MVLEYQNQQNCPKVLKITQSNVFFLYTSTMVSFHMGISLGSDHHSRSESLVSKLLNTAHYWQNMLIWLVLWNMTFMTFHILGMSSSQLTFIFFGGVKPPTSYSQSWGLPIFMLLGSFFVPRGLEHLRNRPRIQLIIGHLSHYISV